MKKILLACFLLTVSLGLLFAERYALVIGNSAYRYIQPLNTPANDATDIAAALRGLGYDVDLRVNAGVDEMEEAVYEYAGRLARDPANEGFFWYAGHGIQADGENFLLPVDLDAGTIAQVKRASYSLSDLMTELENARNRVNVFIIDACRNNSLLPSETRSFTRGLAVVPTVQDTFVMFSTAAGSVADDGAPGARNSPFTEAFLMYIASPGRLDDMAAAVSRETLNHTQNNQRPYIADNILYIENYSLNPDNRATVIAPPSSALAPGQPQDRPNPARPNPAAPPANSTPLATGPRVPVQESRAESLPRAPETFILDNTTVFSMAFAYRNHLNTKGMTNGALFRYTFRESYKGRGEFFIAPNAYFLSLDFGMGDYTRDNGSSAVKEFSPGLGVMWKMRPDAGQRMFLGFGFSVNAVMNWYADEDATSDPYLIGGVHGNFTFRFTPLVALELNAIVSGNADTGAALQSALGFSLTFPYGSKK